MKKHFFTYALLSALLFTTMASSLHAADSDDELRFGVRQYFVGTLPIVTQSADNALVLRFKAALPPAQVALVVEQASLHLAASISASTSIAAMPRVLATDGLYLVEFSRPVQALYLASLASQLRQGNDLLQAYPVLQRGPGRAFYDDKLIVSAKPGQLEAVLAKVNSIIDATLVRHARVPDTALLRVGAAQEHDALTASYLLINSGVSGLRAAEPMLYRELRVSAQANDALADEQWHLYRNNSNVPGAGQIHVEGAWDITKGNADVVIAVLDTGMDLSHPDLQPNLLNGFDAAANDDDPSTECSESPDGADVAPSCPNDKPYRESHATSVAGTAAAAGDNDIGGAGVCPLCSIMPIRLLGGIDSVTSLTTAEAFVRAVDEGAWVLNNSWGTGGSRFFPLATAERDAMRYARLNGREGLGAVVLFAAGNDTADVRGDGYASCSEVIAVAGSSNLDDWAYYSNWGHEIALAAPTRGGAVSEDEYGIVTTDVVGAEGYESDEYNYGFGGTSAASPVAAGLAGLILSANPRLTADQVRIILTSTADKIVADKVNWLGIMGADIEQLWAYDDNGHSMGFGFGRINAEAAVRAALNAPVQGALCDDPRCQVCDTDARCSAQCKDQQDCPDGSLCKQGACSEPTEQPGAIGQPCSADCTYCVSGLDSRFSEMSICTTLCANDDDCGVGFDCRLLNSLGPRLCVPGLASAGEPASGYTCFDKTAQASIVVAGSNGQLYCSDLCFSDDEGACPYGFHCGSAKCDCSNTYGQYCFEYTCAEVTQSQSNWYNPQCFPDEIFGVYCSEDAGCKLGDYCGDDGLCHIDDRAGCFACAVCDSDEDCGPIGTCNDLNDGAGSHCLIPCDVNGFCPGDSLCTEVQLRRGSRFYCVAPTAATDTMACPPDFTCQVACREDIPCPQGSTCKSGVCEPIPTTTNPAPIDENKDQGACGCQVNSSTKLWWPLLGGLFLVWRRRR